jgi:hypothetical protein
VYGVACSGLNSMLSCSLMNAPLDTEFPLVQNRQHPWGKWVPLEFIESLQDLDALCGGCALYEIASSSSCPCLRAGRQRHRASRGRNPFDRKCRPFRPLLDGILRIRAARCAPSATMRLEQRPALALPLRAHHDHDAHGVYALPAHQQAVG